MSPHNAQIIRLGVDNYNRNTAVGDLPISGRRRRRRRKKLSPEENQNWSKNVHKYRQIIVRSLSADKDGYYIIMEEEEFWALPTTPNRYQSTRSSEYQS